MANPFNRNKFTIVLMQLLFFKNTCIIKVENYFPFERLSMARFTVMMEDFPVCLRQAVPGISPLSPRQQAFASFMLMDYLPEQDRKGQPILFVSYFHFISNDYDCQKQVPASIYTGHQFIFLMGLSP
jgi:hypothetical protein